MAIRCIYLILSRFWLLVWSLKGSLSQLENLYCVQITVKHAATESAWVLEAPR